MGGNSIYIEDDEENYVAIMSLEPQLSLAAPEQPAALTTAELDALLAS